MSKPPLPAQKHAVQHIPATATAGTGQRAGAAPRELPHPGLCPDLGAPWRIAITAPARPACIERMSPGSRNVPGVSRGLYLSPALIPEGPAWLPKAGPQGRPSGRSRCSFAATAPSPAGCAACSSTHHLRCCRPCYDADTSNGISRPPKRSLTLPPC